MSNRAWVTLATNDSYGLGALVLAHSLRRAGSLYPAAVLITPSVTEAMRERLRAVFAEVVTVDVLDSRDAAHLALLQRPELGITFTKIHCWSLTQYEKCVFLDADTLVVQNCDELFEREELSAAPDVGWPDCFNSGVFVYQPSQETFENLIKFAQERGSFDGGDQGLLNSFFSYWARGDINKHLPFLYNVTSAAFYSYIPALKHYGQNLKIIHFIGAAKPWLQQFNWESRSVDAPEHLREFLQLWWDLFVGQVHSQLDVTMVEVPEAPPALPPPDVSHHYTPVVDPESEFPWHHPDAQVQEDTQIPVIDMEQFHDPWSIYGGQIPSYKEDVTQQPLSGRVEDHEEMKKYAWEYQPPHQSTNYHDHRQEQSHQQFHHSHQESQHHWEAQSHHSYNQDHGHDNSSHHHSHEQYHPQEYHPHIQEHHSHWQPEPQSSQQHEHYEDHSAQHTCGQQHEYFDQGHVQHSHDHHHTHSSHTHDHQTHHSQPDNCHSHDSEGFSKVNNNQDHGPSITKLISHNTNPVQQVHHVHVHHELPNHVKQKESEQEIMNGDISENESEFHEELRPRHPYDGYYLKHRAVIDSQGRKICTHEIPPTPTPSPPPEYEFEDDPPFSLPEEIPLANGYEEDQSGVAGNLARVVPGAGGAQREALDELTRRQGWEAGNIDYMGADSFDNIWAKISQTLSLPRTSPPKQPSPPKETPVEVAQEASVVDQAKPEVPAEPALAPAEVAVSAPTANAAPAPAEETAAGEAKPSSVEPAVAPVESAPAPVEAAPAPAESAPADLAPALVEATPAAAVLEPAPVEASPAPVGAAPAPVEAAPATVEAAPAPIEAVPAPAPVEAVPAPAPVEAVLAPVEVVPAPVESAPVPAPVEAPPASAPVEAAPAPVETAPAPVETAPAPVESAPAAPAEAAPAPVEAAAEVPVAAPKPTEAAPPTETPAATEPKAPEATPEASAPVKIPTTVEAATESKPAEVPASEIPATVEAIASAPAASEIPATVEACAPGEAPAPAEASKPKPRKEKAKTEPTLPPTPPASPKSPEEPVESPLVPVEAAKEAAPVVPEPSPASPVSPAAAEPAATPEKPSEAPVGSDSPPLANTPSKDEAPAPPAAKSEERRKGGCKLRLEPPAAADPLPTPDSEVEDAAALATSIIASELRTPTVTSPSSEPEPTSPPAPLQPQRLSVDEPEVPTPPVGAVSLAQIGVKTPKAKSSTAAQIESSVTEKAPKEPSTPTSEAPKKKIVKKVVKKVVDKEGASTGGETPVPPPRKKEKKPKEK